MSKTSHELSSQLNSIKARVVQLKTHAQNDFSETKSNLILTNDGVYL